MGRVGATTDLVLFDVAGVRCALRRGEVAALLPLPRLFRPPTLPAPLAGFANLAGMPVAVIDARRLFGLGEAAAVAAIDRHLVRLATGAALLVDRVTEIATVPTAALVAVADGETLNGCVAATLERGGGLVHLLAADRLLMTRERLQLAALTEAATARIAEWSPES